MALPAEAINALLKRICATPIMETLQIEVISLAKDTCETKIHGNRISSAEF
jgi:hypothetical protein